MPLKEVLQDAKMQKSNAREFQRVIPRLVKALGRFSLAENDPGSRQLQSALEFVRHPETRAHLKMVGWLGRVPSNHF